MMNTRPADTMWAAIIVGSLAGDVWLAKHNVDTDDDEWALLTHRVRTPGGWGIAGLLLAHFTGWLPWWLDPFSLVRPIARWLEKR